MNFIVIARLQSIFILTTQLFVPDGAGLKQSANPVRLQMDTNLAETNIWQDTNLRNVTQLFEILLFQVSETSSDSKSSEISLKICLDQEIARSK